MSKRRRRQSLLLLLIASFVLTAATCAPPPPPTPTDRIVFISDRTGNPEVWIMDRSGSNQTQLTDTPEIESSPQLSPGGTKIVFVRELLSAGAQSRLWVMNADGSNQHEVTAPDPPPSSPSPFVGQDREPAWSPDGTKIAFLRGAMFSPDLDTGLLIMNADGTEPFVLSANPRPERLSGLAWSPDGTRIASAVLPVASPNRRVVVINVDGSGSYALTGIHNPFEATFERDPAWSPDGTQIAFAGRLTIGGPTGIWVTNADGSNPVQLTQDGGDDSPSWSPEGDRIAFARGGSIWTMKPDGTDQQQLTTGTQPHWAAPK